MNDLALQNHILYISVHDSITFIHGYDFDKHMDVLKSIKGYPFKKIVQTSKNTTATPINNQNLEFLVPTFKWSRNIQK